MRREEEIRRELRHGMTAESRTPVSERGRPQTPYNFPMGQLPVKKKYSGTSVKKKAP